MSLLERTITSSWNFLKKKSLELGLYAGLLAIASCGRGGDSSISDSFLARKQIGPEGGTVATTDGRVSIDIPPGALTADTTITVTSTSEKMAEYIYDIGPSGLSLLQPATITIAYDPAPFPAEQDLFLASIDDYMQILEDIQVDTLNDRISGKTTHFSEYAIGSYKLTGVNISDFNVTASSFRMPIGDDGAQDLGANLTLLEKGNWITLNYPKISFNINGSSNRWYVATAFNQNRWLNNGWAEPSPAENDVYGCDSLLSSIYSCKGSFHPGEDWNMLGGDLGKPIHAIADGIVLFSQSQQKRNSSNEWVSANFGNILIIGHKLINGEIIGSVYAHMNDTSPYNPKNVVYNGDIIGFIGDSGAAKGAPHLHFEITRDNNILLKVDGNGNIKIPVIDNSFVKNGWYWPGTDSAFIAANYQEPSSLDSLVNATWWAKTYGGSGHDILYSIQQTSDGGYITAGQTKSFGDVDGAIWILKLNNDGTIAWQKAYSGILQDILYSIQQTSDGGYIAGGETFSSGADGLVLKLNSDGSIAWQKAYGGASVEQIEAVQQTSDGGYIVGGLTGSSGTTNDGWILKLNSDGTIAWQKAYGGTAWEGIVSIQQTSDGGYIAGGVSSSGITGVYGYILKLNSDGAMAWHKEYLGIEPESLQQTSDGGYIVTGNTEFPGIDFDSSVLKLNSDGTIAWQKAYGGTLLDYTKSIQQTSDGGYIAAGLATSFGDGSKDGWILKLKPDGICSPLGYDTNVTITNIIPSASNAITASSQDISLTVTNTNLTVTNTNATVQQQAP